MYVIKELIYGLNLSTQANKKHLDNLQEQDFEYMDSGLDGWAYFPYHGGQTCYDVPSFRLGIYISDDDNDKTYLAESMMKAMKNEKTYKTKYNKFKVDLLKTINEYRSFCLKEPIGKHFTKSYQKDCLSSLDWFEDKIKTKDPAFYFSESSS